VANRNIVIKDPTLNEIKYVQFNFTDGNPDFIEAVILLHAVGGEIPDQEKTQRIQFSALTASDRTNARQAMQAALNIMKTNLGF
jgi:hypothetical protein